MSSALKTCTVVLGVTTFLYMAQTYFSSSDVQAEKSVANEFPFLDGIIKEIPQLQGDLEIRFCKAGIANHVFVVENRSNGKSYVLRVMRNRPEKLVKMSKIYQFLQELRPSLTEANIRIPDTIIFPFIVGDKLVMVSEYLEGEHITSDLLPKAAQLMARLHQLETNKKSLSPRFDMPMFFNACKGWPQAAILQRIWESLDLSYTDLLPKGIIHGDFSFSNLLVGKNGSLSLIDCDKMRYDILIDDIALAQIYYGFDEKGNFKKKTFASFVEAYERVRPLTLLEKEHLIDHIKRTLIEIAFVMYYYSYLDPQGSIQGQPGNPEMVQRIKSNPKNCFIDPDFMASAILALEDLKETTSFFP